MLKVQDEYDFSVVSENVNITLFSHIEWKLGAGLKQKGILEIFITQLGTESDLSLEQPKCSGGVGFNVQFVELFVHTHKMQIKVEGKQLDNVLIRAIMFVVGSRLPGILNNMAHSTINPMISNATCEKYEDYL